MARQRDGWLAPVAAALDAAPAPVSFFFRDDDAGWDDGRLLELLGDALQPIFTPPWNRCTADTGRALAELGFRALSREHRAEPLAVPGLSELPVHVDWVRLEPSELAARMAEQLAAGGPLGVMLHHAVMEPESMDRTSDLLALVAAHEQARARPMLQLLR